jgi:hypothetical protein
MTRTVWSEVDYVAQKLNCQWYSVRRHDTLDNDTQHTDT